jgi:hypothetical protein
MQINEVESDLTYRLACLQELTSVTSSRLIMVSKLDRNFRALAQQFYAILDCSITATMLEEEEIYGWLFDCSTTQRPQIPLDHVMTLQGAMSVGALIQ